MPTEYIPIRRQLLTLKNSRDSGKESNLFDSAKKARALNLDSAVEERLTLQQRRVFAVNRCLLSLYTNKHKECLAALTKLEKELAGSELPSLVKAALLAREKRLDECSALLQQYATGATVHVCSVSKRRTPLPTGSRYLYSRY